MGITENLKFFLFWCTVLHTMSINLGRTEFDVPYPYKPKIKENTPILPPPLPQWLQEVHTPTRINKSLESKQLSDLQYEIILDGVLDRITSGESLNTIFKEDARDLNPGHFLRWIHKDPIREGKLHEAQKIGTEVLIGQMIDRANGENSLEDVARSTLAVNTMKFVISAWNKRYRDTKQVELNGSISILKAMEEANNRVITIDANYEDVD